MSDLFPDTSPEAEKVLVDLLRKTPAQRKLEMVGQMNETVRTFALCGLKQRYPQSTPKELRNALAEVLLGTELANRIYGSLISPILTFPLEWRRNKECLMLSEPISVTLLVVDVLDKLGIPYLIGGSIAGAIYGVARSTIDVDIIADVHLQHAVPLADAFDNAFYVSIDSIKEAVSNRGSFNIIHLETMFKVDIFVNKQRPFDKSQFERRIKQVISSEPRCEVYVASAEDNVLAKLEWYRKGGEVSERQWRDVLETLKIQENMDVNYLRHWASVLGVADLMEKALG
jgi:hypothetical protein